MRLFSLYYCNYGMSMYFSYKRVKKMSNKYAKNVYKSLNNNLSQSEQIREIQQQENE